MKKTILALAMVALAPFASAKLGFQADASVGMWMPGLNDDASIGSDFNLKEQLGSEAQSGLVLGARFQHPVPFIPNLALRQTSVSLDGRKDLAEDFEFAGLEVPSGTADLETTLDFSHTDLTLFWGVPFLPLVDIDFGASFKLIRGQAKAEFGGETKTEEFSLPVPMFYLAASVPVIAVPGDLELAADLQILPFGASSVSDITVAARYFLPLPTNILAKAGVEAGYRQFALKIDDQFLGADVSDLASDIRIGGLYLGVTGRF